MRKIYWLLFLLIGVSIASSCSKTETYADKIKKERKAINRLIDTNKIKILSTYPENGVFEDNQFFQDPQSGVYFQVIDSGNGKRVSAEYRTQVTMRFKDAMRIGTSDTTKYSNMGQSGIHDYMNITYGIASTYTDGRSTAGSNFSFKSPGCVVPLSYVGDSAIVKIIVPFGYGSALQQQTYEPIYFDYLIYSFQD